MPTIHVNPDPCIACTTCTVFCPVAQATGEFLGPRMIGPALQRFRLLNMAEDNSLSYCSNCKNCDISCPQGVQVGAINMAPGRKALPRSIRIFCATGSSATARRWGISSALFPLR